MDDYREDFLTRLCEIIEEIPELYNPTSENYLLPHLVLTAYSVIGDELFLHTGEELLCKLLMTYISLKLWKT